jgi:Flp pilus assembly CpaE family ATPase
MTIELDETLIDKASIASAAARLSIREFVSACVQAGIATLAENSVALAAAFDYLDKTR